MPAVLRRTEQEMLQYLKKEEKRLEDSISKYMEIDLNDAAEIASKNLKVVQAKIREIEAK